MSNKIEYWGMTLSLLFLLLSTSGCRKDLYYESGDTAGHQVEVKVTWPTGVTTPEGSRAIFYPTGGGTPHVYNLPASGGSVVVPSGTYTVVVFNNDTESVKLADDGSNSTLQATTSVLQASTKSLPSANIMYAPDAFYSYKIDNFQVTSGVVDDVLEATPSVRVNTFKVRVNIGGGGGVNSVSTATGYVSGLYGGYFPGTQIYPSGSNVIVSFDMSTRGTNYLEGTVSTFGVNKSSGSSSAQFRLSLTLSDGSTKVFDADVSDQLNVDLSNNDVLVTIPGTIDISATNSGSSSSGFSVTVEGWGSPTVVDL